MKTDETFKGNKFNFIELYGKKKLLEGKERHSRILKFTYYITL